MKAALRGAVAFFLAIVFSSTQHGAFRHHSCGQGLRAVAVGRANSMLVFLSDQHRKSLTVVWQQNLSSAARVGSTHAGACGWLWPLP